MKEPPISFAAQQAKTIKWSLTYLTAILVGGAFIFDYLPTVAGLLQTLFCWPIVMGSSVVKLLLHSFQVTMRR